MNNGKKIRFVLIRSGETEEKATWSWSVFLPTQIKHVETRKEAVRNLGQIIKGLMEGNFEIEEVDLVNSRKEHPFFGGWQKLIDDLGKKTKSALKERNTLYGKSKTARNGRNKIRTTKRRVKRVLRTV